MPYQPRAVMQGCNNNDRMLMQPILNSYGIRTFLLWHSHDLELFRSVIAILGGCGFLMGLLRGLSLFYGWNI